jgi:hypothetical protein
MWKGAYWTDCSFHQDQVWYTSTSRPTASPAEAGGGGMQHGLVTSWCRGRLIRQAMEIEFHLINTNREAGFFLSTPCNLLIYSLNKKILSNDKLVTSSWTTLLFPGPHRGLSPHFLLRTPARYSKGPSLPSSQFRIPLTWIKLMGALK